VDNKKKKALSHNREMKRATAFGAEILAKTAPRQTFVPKTGGHRPLDMKRRRKMKSAEQGKRADTSNCNGKSRKPFHITFFGIVTNLKKCYGCGTAFNAKHTKPPHDIILKYFCRRQYTNKQGANAIARNMQAAYFHLNLDCARKVEPLMELTDIILHSEVRDCLTEKHKELLVQFGVIM